MWCCMDKPQDWIRPLESASSGASQDFIRNKDSYAGYLGRSYVDWRRWRSTCARFLHGVRPGGVGGGGWAYCGDVSRRGDRLVLILLKRPRWCGCLDGSTPDCCATPRVADSGLFLVAGRKSSPPWQVIGTPSRKKAGAKAAGLLCWHHSVLGRHFNRGLRGAQSVKVAATPPWADSFDNVGCDVSDKLIREMADTVHSGEDAATNS